MNLTEIIQESIKKTNKQYIEYSEFSICYAPEYLITSNILHDIFKLKKNSSVDQVYLEWNICDLIKDENLKSKENVRKGKCDICVLFDDRSNSIIEVKNTVKNQGNKLKSIIGDIKRIKLFILDENSSFKDGYVSFLTIDKNENDVFKRAKLLESKIKREFPELKFENNITIFKEYEEELEENYLASIVMKISK